MLVDNKGFTLIELLVVIAVLGILAAIAIPRLTGFTDKARVSNLESSGQTVRSNIELYIAENGKVPSKSKLTEPSSSYYVNMGDGYSLSSLDGNADGYSIKIEDNNNSSWSATIKPSGVVISSP
jgi:prepilin-type N-terminal cleavage/methylation domain-containing protein